MKYQQTDTSKSNGSHLQGYVESTFDEIIEIFGSPKHGPDAFYLDKVTCEWVLEFEDGTIATIYDWKMCETPYNKYYWHIGGFDQKSVDLIQEIVAIHRLKKTVEKGN